ncbi:MAG: hypothetical protein LCI00_11160 [Chloroflexi bacterium]|nr:hypothetical protein [Chloroflexota bacterium]MCC6896143.1 hypothetical protein [Anaerolineae bacterium]
MALGASLGRRQRWDNRFSRGRNRLVLRGKRLPAYNQQAKQEQSGYAAL